MSKTLRIISYAAFAVLGWLIASVFDSCNKEAEPASRPTAFDGTIYTRTDTLYRDSVIYRDRWRTRTVSVVRYDTTRPIIESYPYTRQASATTQTDDTIDVTYHHPEGLFDIGFRPAPDTVRTVTITRDSVIAVVEKRKWGIGVHAGIGGQWSGDDVIRAGVQVGVGVNFNLWEP